MKKSFTTALLLILPLIAHSKTETEEKLQALQLLKKYTETVACYTTFDAEKDMRKLLKNVITIEIDQTPYHERHIFYILWNGNIGCTDGNSLNTYKISEVSKYNGPPKNEKASYILTNQNPLGDDLDNKVNSNFIEEIKLINKETIAIISFEQAPDDSRNSASKKYQYIFKYDGFEWKMTNRKFIKN